METLKAFDTALFTSINQGSSSFLDLFMVWITHFGNFKIPVIIAVVALIASTGKEGIRAALLVGITLALADSTSGFLKDTIQRVRPCNAIEGARVLVGCTSSYAMPSSHAANSFGAAVMLSLLYRRVSPLFITAALLVAYSRVYVGVHYPLDTVVGGVIGITSASLFYTLEGLTGLRERWATLPVIGQWEGIKRKGKTSSSDKKVKE